MDDGMEWNGRDGIDGHGDGVVKPICIESVPTPSVGAGHWLAECYDSEPGPLGQLSLLQPLLLHCCPVQQCCLRFRV